MTADINQAGNQAGAPRGGCTSPPCILLVEDEVLVRMLAADQLQELGYEIAEAGSAADALTQARRLGARMHAAVIDVGLPDRSGGALAAELRAMYSCLPIVVASGHGAAALGESWRKDRFVRFLGKPYDGRQLEAALRSLGVQMPG